MNKDIITGNAKQAVGAVKEAAGKILGDTELIAAGKEKQVEGQLQSAIGGVIDIFKK